jgi:hypothetical protein
VGNCMGAGLLQRACASCSEEEEEEEPVQNGHSHGQIAVRLRQQSDSLSGLGVSSRKVS